MKKDKIKILLATTMVSIFVINGILINKVDAKVSEQNTIDIQLPELNPMPKNIKVDEGVLTLTQSINLKGKEVADADALRILTEFLKENNIQINEEYDESSTTLIIGEVDDEIAELDEAKERIGVGSADSLRGEGYVLAVDSDDNGKGTILIEGKDGDGTFYGVKTLTQLIEKDDQEKTLNDVIISDEPSMRTRGIVEGFYGTPWSQQDRLDQIKFYGENKMNTYIYAPKDDKYHRENWREPYPESEMSRMNELIQTSKENKVDFVFALSPGIDIRFDGEEGEDDFKALINKCESLYKMGVRSFAIFYDDINNWNGVKQATVLNRFNKEFIKAKGDVNPLITVPTQYDTHSMGTPEKLNRYTREFSSTLDSDIMVMWTGSAVVPEGLDLENAKFVKSIYGDRMGIWWNYPVTDYLKSKLALGPIYNVDKALEGEIDFFTMNPMEHADLSKISLATGADYSWNTSNYDYDKSWNKAIEMQYGNLANDMKTFANHSTRLDASWGIGREDAPEIRKTMDTLWSNLAKEQDISKEANVLYTEFSNMVKSADRLKSELKPEILNECSSNLDKLKLLGENGKIALDLVIAEKNQDKEQAQNLENILKSNMVDLSSGKRVSEKTVLAFIKEALNYDALPSTSFTVSNTLVAPGEEVKFTNTSSLVTNEIEWIFEGANIKTSTEQNPVVTYDKEGIYDVTLKGRNSLGEDITIKEGIITVTEAVANGKVNVALGKTATASSFVPSEKPEFAIDGNTKTKWCAVGNDTHILDIDLGGINTISDIIIKHAEEGGEPSGLNTAAYRIEVSTNGTDYKEVVKVTDNKNKVTIDPISVEKATNIRLIVDKPTQGDDTAARIYEVEVMGLEGDVELPNKEEGNEPPVDGQTDKPEDIPGSGENDNNVNENNNNNNVSTGDNNTLWSMTLMSGIALLFASLSSIFRKKN